MNQISIERSLTAVADLDRKKICHVLRNQWRRNLLLMCAVQLALLLLAGFVGFNSIVCTRMPPQPTATQENVDCKSCTALTISWSDSMLLVGGLFVISVGVISVLTKDELLCNAYGLIMIFFAALVGILSVLIAIEIPSFVRDVGSIDQATYPACVAATRLFISSSRRKAVLYAVSCITDLVGAIFALSWKTYLSYEKIADYQATVMLATTL